ncbi:hypothetical protein CMI41_03475, partial [Candidatus Pacearchaeota archaeon]|nr:hypothetical protein [Candidatus Pacearchaeota archaeon]
DNYLLTDQVKELKGLLLAYTEVSKISELDPRLSEVHRYWFDKTAPSCEVLDTPERFGDALGQFLNESSIPEEYGVTQKQLKSVLEIAENMGEMEEIWNQLIGRGPGLASADDYSSDERYA